MTTLHKNCVYKYETGKVCGAAYSVPASKFSRSLYCPKHRIAAKRDNTREHQRRYRQEARQALHEQKVEEQAPQESDEIKPVTHKLYPSPEWVGGTPSGLPINQSRWLPLVLGGPVVEG